MATQESLQQALTEKKEPTSFPAMLKAFLPEIQKALPRHLSGERMGRIALTAFRRTPKLALCDPRSVFAAVIQASQLGLEPDTMGRSFLVPYKNNKTGEFECQFIPGWKGLVDLVNRAGSASVWTGAVFEGDTFDYALGDRPFVTHKPGDEDNPNKLLYVYAVGRVKGAEWPVIEVWPIKKIWKHRDRYNKVGSRHYSYENQELYARKIPLLQVVKYLPCSAELVSAIALSDAADAGTQGLTVQDAIEGTWTASQEATENLAPTTPAQPEKPSNGQEMAFAKAMDAIEAEDFSLAESLLNDMSAKDAAIVVSKLPPKG